MNEAVTRCPTCGAANAEKANTCWLCHEPMAEKLAVAEWIPVKPSQAVGSGTFTITSLLLIITLISVCLGMGVVAPGLGILLGIISLPALIRTILVVSRRKLQGETVEWESKFGLFIASFGTVLLAGVAAGAVFFGSCVAACYSSMTVARASGKNAAPVFFVLLTLGAVAGVAVGIYIIYRHWRNRLGR